MNDQPSPRARPPAPRLADFPIKANDIIRFADLDPQTHVNNAVFATYFETGRVALLRDPTMGMTVPGATFVLARIEIDFLRELRWPGTLEIGTAVAEISTRSFTYAQALFRDGDCAATGRSTMVLIDGATRRSRPIPEDVVTRLQALRPRNE